MDPLHEEDQAFLQRLQAPRRHTTFTALLLREIRGHPWRRGGVPQTDPRAILGTVTLALGRYAQGTDEAQWGEAITTYWAEALRYVGWLLAWEQRSKAEKDAYRRKQYQAWKRAHAST